MLQVWMSTNLKNIRHQTTKTKQIQLQVRIHKGSMPDLSNTSKTFISVFKILKSSMYMPTIIFKLVLPKPILLCISNTLLAIKQNH